MVLDKPFVLKETLICFFWWRHSSISGGEYVYDWPQSCPNLSSQRWWFRQKKTNVNRTNCKQKYRQHGFNIMFPIFLGDEYFEKMFENHLIAMYKFSILEKHCISNPHFWGKHEGKQWLESWQVYKPMALFVRSGQNSHYYPIISI